MDKREFAAKCARLVSGGHAALSQAEHDAALANFYNIFGDVMDGAMILDLLGSSG